MNASAFEGRGFVREAELTVWLSISKSTLRRWVRHGTFPAPVRLSAKIIAWRVADVMAWLRDR